jgi:four helix bundle protein
MYGLTSQLRRAAVSVPSNIAEGFKRIGTNDKLRFYNIAESSLEEAKYQLLLANDLQYSNTKDLIIQVEEVSKLLNGLIKSFKKN